MTDLLFSPEQEELLQQEIAELDDAIACQIHVLDALVILTILPILPILANREGHESPNRQLQPRRLPHKHSSKPVLIHKVHVHRTQTSGLGNLHCA